MTSSASRLLGVLALLAVAVVGLPAAAQDGTDRDTALRLVPADGEPAAIAIVNSQLAFPDPPVERVLLARDDVFADALASGSLQAESPLLLTDGQALDPRVAEELARLAPTTVTILGGTAAVSESVAGELAGLGYTVERLQGSSRVDTAVAVAGTTTGDTALLARAYADGDPTQAFADSLAAGGWAAETGWPVLLTETDVLSAATREALASGRYETVFIVGGEDAVAPAVADEVAALVTDVERVAGATRDETAVAIAARRGFASADDAAVTILTDGFGDDAWVDGLTVAALAGEGYPVVLASSLADELPPATLRFLGDAAGFADSGLQSGGTFGHVDLVCTSTVPGDPADTVIGDGDPPGDQCIAAGALRDDTTVEVFPPVASNLEIAVQERQLRRGQEMVITIDGLDGAAVVTLSGCGFDDPQFGVVPDESGIVTLRVVITDAQPLGECDLTIGVAAPDGAALGSATEPLVITPRILVLPGTIRPQLVGAEVVGTVETGADAGTTVRFLFDRIVNVVDPAWFFVTTSDNVRFAAGTATLEPDAQAVVARFTTSTDGLLGDLTDPDIAERLTVASVDSADPDGAATSGGLPNPEGGAPIGFALFEPLPFGMTTAPDITGASGFRLVDPANPTTSAVAVDVAFDEAAFTITPTGSGFHAIGTDGSDVTCTGPVMGNTDPAGGPTAGGNGTAVLTVICPAGVTQLGTARFGIDAASVADGAGALPICDIIDPSDELCVSDTTTWETADVTAGGTNGPDLTSARIEPEAPSSAGPMEVVVYTFDGPVTPAPQAGGLVFFVYDSNGDDLVGSALDTSGSLPLGPNEVAVLFNDTLLIDAVGVFIWDGAVSSTDTGIPNQQHEIAFPDPITIRRPGRTAAPDLRSAARGAATVEHTFDETITTLATPLGLPPAYGFYLYDPNGNRLTATTCTPTAAIVTCTDYIDATGTPATPEAFNAAVLATIDAAVVNDNLAQANPEGAVAVA